jgi:hypothetical protein
MPDRIYFGVAAAQLFNTCPEKLNIIFTLPAIIASHPDGITIIPGTVHHPGAAQNTTLSRKSR